MGSFSSWHWLIFAAVVWIIWATVKAKPKSVSNSGGVPSAAPEGDKVAKIRGNGRFETEVVGESHYAASFNALLRHHKPSDLDDEWTGDAVLRLEESNPHDKNAVAVFLEGRQVGYLSRDMALDFRKSLVRDGFGQLREVAVPARLYWGGEDAIFSVSLDLPQG